MSEKFVVDTKSYRVTFEERNGGRRGPVGRESKFFERIGDPLGAETERLIERLGHGGRAPAISRFDSLRNEPLLLEALMDPTKAAAVSGRKPSGPCHFGHLAIAEALAFIQEGGFKVFIPIADLEAKLDPKLGNDRLCKIIAADNLLDWGAVVALDSAHVYFQSEEGEALRLGYMCSRQLTFQKVLDTYGAKTFSEELQFMFGGAAQVADILLPQVPKYGYSYSFMLSGPDQDAHLLITNEMVPALLADGIVQREAGALYVKHVPSLGGGEKSSASDSSNTLFLGRLANVYEGEGENRKLVDVRVLGPEESALETFKKLHWAALHGNGNLERFLAALNTLIGYFKDEPLDSSNYREGLERALKQHGTRRREVLWYACLCALADPSTPEWLRTRAFSHMTGPDLSPIGDRKRGQADARPGFWSPLPEGTAQPKSALHSDLRTWAQGWADTVLPAAAAKTARAEDVEANGRLDTDGRWYWKILQADTIAP